MSIRVGLGTDRHRLEAGSGLVVGGVDIESELSAVAHSDGDVCLHAIVDALLGSLALGDIGELFPNDDPANADAASSRFVEEAVRRVTRAGARIVNIDVTVSLERPKLLPHRERIRAQIAELTGIDVGAVSFKAKTGEKVDAVGEGHAIEAIALATVETE